jgi:hypothetical protein
MGYFSNGSEGESYYAFYCEKCIHDVNKECPVWTLHLEHNYCSEADPIRTILDTFIARSRGDNAKCKMFVLREGAEPLPEPKERSLDE